MNMIRKTLLLFILAASLAQAQGLQGLTYGTYSGGTGRDVGHGVAVDSLDEIIMVGYTASTNYPTLDAFQRSIAGDVNAFVSKFNSNGKLIWSTYLGGSQQDQASAVVTDSTGNIYVVGTTNSPNFPVTRGVVQPSLGGAGTNAFVAKFGSSGNLIWSTFLGNSPTQGNGIAVDSQGNVFVAGDTNDVVNEDGFVTELNSTATKVIFTRTIGGSGTDSIHSIALLGEEAYVAGYTNSKDFPTTPGAFQKSCGSSCSPYFNGFVAELGSSGVAYATYLGGNTTTVPGTTLNLAIGIAVDPGGNAYVTGTTNTIDFPITSSPFQKVYGGTTDLPGGVAGCIDFISGQFPCGDAFVTKLNPTGTKLIYSTYLGGSTADIGYSILVDQNDDAWVGGYTQSYSSRTHKPFPTTADAYQKVKGGGLDAFLTEVSPSGSTLIYSTYFGGEDDELAFGLALDSTGNGYLAGRTISVDTPVTPDAFQRVFHGNVDGFIAKIRP
jgi:hypothetical protein